MNCELNFGSYSNRLNRTVLSKRFGDSELNCTELKSKSMNFELEITKSSRTVPALASMSFLTSGAESELRLESESIFSQAELVVGDSAKLRRYR